MNISRPYYLNRIMPYVSSGMIKVLTGQRRVGKSFILKQVEAEIRKSDPMGNFITINIEDFAFSHITDAQTLNDEITARLSATSNNYIFIDEVQEVKDFDKVIRSLNLDSRNDIYVTGSNSMMLSSEIASRLAGRSIEIRVHPLMYSEFLEFHGLNDSDDALKLYMQYGGMPYLRNLASVDNWAEYLVGVADAVVYRDIVSRHSIRNNDFLQRLLMFLSDNIGQLFTAKRITDYLKSQNISSQTNSVITYIDYICGAYIVNRVRRWNIIGKRFFEIGEKYYFEDLGIRNAIIGYRPGDMGKIMENIVYNSLVSRGYEVNVGVMATDREIDFIAEKNSERIYVQVALRVDSRETADREFGNLLKIDDNYPKILVTLGDSAPASYKGIRMVALREFLLEE